MSTYGVNRALWGVYKTRENAQLLVEAPDEYLKEFPLTDTERKALAARDYRTLFEGGAHPFLVYMCAFRLAGAFSYQFVTDYIEKLDGLELVDIVT